MERQDGAALKAYMVPEGFMLTNQSREDVGVREKGSLMD